MLRVAQVGLHVFYRFNPHARDLPIAAPEPQSAVFTSAPAADAPALRLANALVQKPDATAAQPVQPAKDAKLPTAPPVGLSKAAEPEPSAHAGGEGAS
jgi:hypothetical protein